MRRSGPLLALLLLAAVPAGASAATVTADTERSGSVLEGLVKFTAAKGETNRLTVKGGDHRVVFRDRANRVRARGECEQLDRRTVRCPAPDNELTISLRDGNDRVTAYRPSVRADGGAGDDILTGSRNRDELSGGAGDDVLTGGRDRDELTGGPGTDTLLGGRGEDTLADGETDALSAPDTFDGGPSADVLDYSARTADLTVDLAVQTTSTGDAFTNVESLNGGAGNDMLTGDAHINAIEGGAGNDAVHGGDGRDELEGGDGNDAVFGDAGDDIVSGGLGDDALSGGDGDDLIPSYERMSSDTETMTCGAGADIIHSHLSDTVQPDCEEMATVNYALRAPVIPALTDQTATFEISCRDCAGTISLRSTDDVDFGGARFAVPEGEKAPVTVTLTPAGATALEAGAVVVVGYRLDRDTLGDSGGYRVFLRR